MTSGFAAYVTTAGACWVDFDIYMPERWADDAARRARARVPEDLQFTTKPDLAAAQIRRLAASGPRFVPWTVSSPGAEHADRQSRCIGLEPHK